MPYPAWALTPFPSTKNHDPRVSGAPSRGGDAPAANRDHVPKTWTRTILLVEDDAYLAALAEMHLETLGYHIAYAGTARRALAMLAEGAAVDMVFTDILMPGGMNGIDFAKVVRARMPGLPIVLTTGSQAAAADARAQGFTVVERPCPVDVLESTLRGALGGQSSAGQPGSESANASQSVVRLDSRRPWISKSA
jgi:DNA-binding NtrC family response regulator